MTLYSASRQQVNQPSHKTFYLQFVLPEETSETSSATDGADTEYHSQTLGRAWGVLLRRGNDSLEERTRRVRDTPRDQSTEANGRDSWASRDHGDCRGLTYSLHIYYDWVAWCSCGTPNSGSGDCPWLFCLLVGLFPLPLLGCLAQPWYEEMCLVSRHLILPCLVDILGRSALFWNKRGVDLEERGDKWGLGEEERRNHSQDVIYERRINNKNKYNCFK